MAWTILSVIGQLGPSPRIRRRPTWTQSGLRFLTGAQPAWNGFRTLLSPRIQANTETLGIAMPHDLTHERANAFQACLGDGFDRLPDTIRRAHLGRIRLSGHARVTRGGGVANALANIMG